MSSAWWMLNWIGQPAGRFALGVLRVRSVCGALLPSVSVACCSQHTQQAPLMAGRQHWHSKVPLRGALHTHPHLHRHLTPHFTSPHFSLLTPRSSLLTPRSSLLPFLLLPRCLLPHNCRYSEQSRTRCIGMTIETRPDFCLTPHLSHMLAYGCTRLEIGLQVCVCCIAAGRQEVDC